MVLRPSAGLPLLVAVLTASSCTWLVVDDALHAPAPCHAPGDCAAGFACTAGACAAVPDADGPPRPGTPIDSAGGVVTGPDGVVLTLDPGAVDKTVQIVVTEASATNVPVGFLAESRFYEIAPSASLSGRAVLAIPRAGGPCASCRVLQRPARAGDPWRALVDDGDGGALVDLAGVYALGVVTR